MARGDNPDLLEAQEGWVLMGPEVTEDLQERPEGPEKQDPREMLDLKDREVLLDSQV